MWNNEKRAKLSKAVTLAHAACWFALACCCTIRRCVCTQSSPNRFLASDLPHHGCIHVSRQNLKLDHLFLQLSFCRNRTRRDGCQWLSDNVHTLVDKEHQWHVHDVKIKIICVIAIRKRILWAHPSLEDVPPMWNLNTFEMSGQCNGYVYEFIFAYFMTDQTMWWMLFMRKSRARAGSLHNFDFPPKFVWRANMMRIVVKYCHGWLVFGWKFTW